MAYFARKLRYAASDGDEGACFMALVELSKKKGGRPVGYVLYHYSIRFNDRSEGISARRAEMVRLKAKDHKEAIRRFWPSDERGCGKEFPGYPTRTEGVWEKTTRWLYKVAVGGSYEHFDRGTWVKVGTPARWSARHTKKPLRGGNISHILILRQAQLAGLESAKSDLEAELDELKGWDSDNDCECEPEEENRVRYAEAESELKKVEVEIEEAENRIKATQAEMRFVLQRMFPTPFGRTPRRQLREKPRAWMGRM